MHWLVSQSLVNTLHTKIEIYWYKCDDVRQAKFIKLQCMRGTVTN